MPPNDISHSELFELIDRLSHGILIVDSAGTIVFANHAASMMVDRADVVARGAGGTLVAGPVMHRALQLATSRTATRGDVVTLVGRDGGRLLAYIAPFRPACQTHPEPRALVCMVDPMCDDLLQATADMWRRLYHLTAAEVIVAEKVSRGEGLRAVADQLCVSLSTVRAHLRSIFNKTGTHRQAELTSLLYNTRMVSMNRG